jgi:acetylornithine aminotransferase
LLARLRVELSEHPQVLAIRGQGLMIGIELASPCRDLAQRAAQEHALLINVTRGKIIRLLPPLTLDAKEVEMIVRGITRLLDQDR